MFEVQQTTETMKLYQINEQLVSGKYKRKFLFFSYDKYLFGFM